MKRSYSIDPTEPDPLSDKDDYLLRSAFVKRVHRDVKVKKFFPKAMHQEDVI